MRLWQENTWSRKLDRDDFMINQTSYENFGMGLYSDAEAVVFSILGLAYFINKKAIESPESIYNYQGDFDSKVEKVASDFDSNWKEWASFGLAAAYIAGLKQAESQINQLGFSTVVKNKISNETGTALLKGSFFGNGGFAPNVKKMFAKYPKHLSLYGAFKKAVESNLQNQKFQIIRKGNDIFRDIAITAGNRNYKDGDIFVRRKFSQELLNRYAKEGIQTVTYKNGAKYSIDSYCEMLGRTMTGRAAVQASLNRFFESGYTLVSVSSHFRACDLCSPYEGKILSIERNPEYESIADAETQGLFHCRCAHDVSMWWQGKTPDENVRIDSGEQELIDRYGYTEAQKISYSAQQKQRYIERNIRNWKRRNSISLDEDTRKYTNNKIRAWQYKQREHLKQNAFLPRKYSREQIKRAY